MPPRGCTTDIQARINAKLEFIPATGCLLWHGALSSQSGYPTVWADGTTVYVARWLWERANGPIDQDHEIHHGCGRGDHRCCALAHLACLSKDAHTALHHAEKVRAWGLKGAWIRTLVRRGMPVTEISSGLRVPRKIVSVMAHIVRDTDASIAAFNEFLRVAA